MAGGHKTLLFADSPGNLELLGRELDRRGIDNLVFHGEIPIGKRTKAFKERFRRGDCPVMLASFGVTRRGHNIPEADRVILFNRLWSAREFCRATTGFVHIDPLSGVQISLSAFKQSS